MRRLPLEKFEYGDRVIVIKCKSMREDKIPVGSTGTYERGHTSNMHRDKRDYSVWVHFDDVPDSCSSGCCGLESSLDFYNPVSDLDTCRMRIKKKR